MAIHIPRAAFPLAFALESGQSPDMQRLSNLFWLVLGRLADAYSVLGIQGTGVLLSAILGGTYAAWATNWLAAWGPIAWVACGLAVAISLLIALLLYENIAAKRQVRRFALLAQAAGHANAMEEHFRTQRLRLSDFFHPFHIPNIGKTFNNCEIIGPGNVALVGGTLVNVGFMECQFVVLKPDEQTGGRTVKGVTIFENSNFIGGRFVQCTFFIFPDMLPKIRRGWRSGNIDIITYLPEEQPTAAAKPAAP